MTILLPLAAYVTALAVAYLSLTRLPRLLPWIRVSGDSCRTCHLLGQIPFGPPYWLLRTHLRRIVQATDYSDRETIQ